MGFLNSVSGAFLAFWSRKLASDFFSLQGCSFCGIQLVP